MRDWWDEHWPAVVIVAAVAGAVALLAWSIVLKNRYIRENDCVRTGAYHDRQYWTTSCMPVGKTTVCTPQMHTVTDYEYLCRKTGEHVWL